jgi:hypothetical protein
MSSWVSVWTPLRFAFSWVALNLASGVALGLCEGGLGRSGDGFAAVTLVGSGPFLTSGGFCFTGLTLVA